MDGIGVFVKKRRPTINVESIGTKVKKLHWYQKPINKEDFTSRRSKDGKLYLRHTEWHKTIWIGPYTNEGEVNTIINSYVEESQKEPLNRKLDVSKVHSVHIEDESFFR